jgi:hypothetical protein
MKLEWVGITDMSRYIDRVVSEDLNDRRERLNGQILDEIWGIWVWLVSEMRWLDIIYMMVYTDRVVYINSYDRRKRSYGQKLNEIWGIIYLTN